MRNCGLVLGTNAMTAFGMQVLHSNSTVICPSPIKYIACEESGEKVQPSGEVTELSQESSEQPESTSCTSGDEQITSKDTGKLEQVTRVILSQIVHLGLQHTKEVKVEIRQLAGMGSGAEMLGIIVPDEECLAEHKCDFAEILWRGDPKFTVRLNNWGLESQTLAKGHEIRFVETADIVGTEDPLWSGTQDMVTVRVCQDQTEPSERRKALRDKLQISAKCPKREKQQLEELLLELEDAFALDDSELSETDLITHNIDKGGQTNTNSTTKAALCSA